MATNPTGAAPAYMAGVPVPGTPGTPGPGAGAPPSAQQVLAAVETARRQAEEALRRAAAAEAELSRTRSEHTEHLRLITASLESSAKKSGQKQWDIVDTKLLQKPQSFKGEEDRWPTWSFKLLAYIAALDNKSYLAMT